ncbi:putative kinase [Diaminobutyricimonas aerilata]|uniref:Putative kinase n=1 Tax=Diaminobutyricimonas aerilata TaxID=1162967 RepID=A0A2M9CMD8_9MICO|nr:ATP-binding protein [Diaminobutyricimonas aerilata]PJJ73055.1 putative kinase [Diaminobutyricimonas aerilata]
MANPLLLINGLPASGKSTLAEDIATRLGWPLLSKDDIKEALADLVGPAVPSSNLGMIAMDTIWSLTAHIGTGVVVESFWWAHRDREHVERGVRESGAETVVELWCEVDDEVARQRYEERERHVVHEPDWDLWDSEEWKQNPPVPLDLGPVVWLRTDSEYDVDAVMAELGAAFSNTDDPEVIRSES